MQTRLAKDDKGDLIGHSKGGISPSGWSCDALPYMVEFDNYGYSGQGGKSVGGIWVWGYDEISWFAHQPPNDKKQWLRYAFKWMHENAPNGHLQMPTRRITAAPTHGDVWMFNANTRSKDCPTGFSIEDTIKNLWRQ